LQLVEWLLVVFLCLVIYYILVVVDIVYVLVVVDIVYVLVVVERDLVVLTVLLLGQFLQMTTGLLLSTVSTCTARATCASTVKEVLVGIDLGLGLGWG
jgi:hypothetical protein